MPKIKLSPYARIFYYEWLLDQTSSRYNLSIDQVLHGNLSIEKLKNALKRYIADHVVLNSHIQEIDGNPCWIQNNTINELEYLPNPVTATELLNYVSRSFDICNEPLYRFRLLRISDGIYRLIIVMHHLVMDGSASLDSGVFATISNYYNDENYKIKYNIDEQINKLSSIADTFSTELEKNKNKYKKFWYQQLNNIENVNLNFLKIENKDIKKDINKFFNPIQEVGFSWGPSELIKLDKIKLKYGITPYVYGQCIFALLLSRYARQEQIVIAYPFAIKEGLNFIYGAQINTNLIPYKFNDETTIIDLFEQNKEFFKLTIRGEIKPGYCPITEIMQEGINKNLLNVCFAQTFFREKSFDFNEITKAEPYSELAVDGIAKDTLLFEHDARKYTDKLNYRVRFDSRYINLDLLTNFVTNYKRLYLEILNDLLAGNEQKKISDYSLLSLEQYHKIVNEFNLTKRDYPSNQTIHKLFEEQVKKTPDAIAIAYENVRLSFAELNSKANQLAHYLIQNYSIKPDDLIALHFDRSEYVLIAMLGILKAGGAYVPIEPNSPSERIRYILDDTKAKLILANNIYRDRLKKIIKQNFLHLDVIFIDDKKTLTKLEKQKNTNPSATTTSNNLIYVIYTSGTTGSPKGVMIEHNSVVNFINHTLQFIFPDDVIMNYINYSFDAVNAEIYPALLNGNVLHIISENLRTDLGALYKYIKKHNITFIVLPSVVATELSLHHDLNSTKLRTMVVGGDIYHGKLNHLKIINQYGPTEATICSTLRQYKANDSYSNIGKPISNVTSYVMDSMLNVLPIGVTGELFIGGIGLARGYLNNPILTQEKFISNPFQTKEEKQLDINGRLYKTGDLVRMLPDGNLEFAGRNDSQIKISGYRVELGEIENKLLSHPDITQTVVLTNGNYLAAYYVAKNKLADDLLTKYLEEHLPTYMLPNAFVYVEKFLLTPNGKIDYKALPKPEYIVKHDYVPPQTQLEQKLGKIFSEILGVSENKISIKNSFFNLGGNSLAAIRLVSTINQRCKSNIQVRDIFNNGTIENLAKLLSEKINKFIYQDYIIKDSNTAGLYQPFELTNIQQAYYFGRLGNFTLGNTSAHLYIEYEFKSLDVVKLEIALNKLIARHENLRVIFENGKQRYIENYPFYHVKFYQLNNIAELTKLRKEYSHKMYAVDKLWLFDIFVSNVENKYLLHFSIDGLIMDAYSTWIFWDELSKLYQDQKCKLPKIDITYRDYIKKTLSIRQSQLFTNAKNYWLNKINDYNFTFNLPLLKQPDAIVYPKFARISKEIDAEIWDKITKKAHHYGIGQTVVILHIYGYVLSYWSNQSKLCVNLTLFNRLPLHDQINNIAGDFTALELFNFDNTSNNSANLLTLFKDTYNKLWDDVEHNLFDGLDFQRLVREKLPLSSSFRDRIIAPVVLTSIFGKNYGGEDILDKSCLGIIYAITQTPQIWLDNKAYELDGKLIAEWDYVEELFDRKIIEAMHEHYCSLITYLADADWEANALPILEPPKFDKEIVEKANSTQQPYSEDTLFGRYESAVINEKLGDATAIIDCANNNREYKYCDLLKDSDLLAHNILKTTKIINNKLIAVLGSKGYTQIISTISVMKAGFAYLPLNIDWPLARIEEILLQSDTKILLISRKENNFSELYNRLVNKFTLIVVEDVLDQVVFSDQNVKPLLPKVNADDVAYVIFTSGSTGKPKGVTISHRGALNTIDSVNAKFNITNQDKILAISELSFDLSVYDIFGLLAVGGTIVIPSQKHTKDPKYWLGLIKQHQISVWNTVPQLAELLVDEMDLATNMNISSIRLFLLSGDWIPIGLPNRIKKYCYLSKVISLGGATEGSIWSIWYEINQVQPEWNSIPYGVAMPNQKMFILNDNLQHCPIGVVGEIYIGGIGVALNYWHDQTKTEASFIHHPEFGRLYKTGDMGKWNSNGYIEFMGRLDTQAKLRGYRIELGEIENKLLTYPGITQAVVLIKEHTNGNKYLVAYYVSPNKLNDEDILNFLAGKLPEYMVPNLLVYLSEPPLTPNDKFDLSALKEPQFSTGASVVAPVNELESKICALFAEVLELPIKDISMNDDFFRLGGDSISAIRLASKLQQYLKIDFSDLFQLKTPANIVQRTPIANETSNLLQKLEQVKLVYKNERIVDSDLSFAKQKRNSYLEEVKQFTFKQQLKDIQNLLLTGATGFLGCHILYQLLANTGYKVYLLVRGNSNEHAYNRLNNKFTFYFGKSLDSYKDRIVVLKTNLEQPKLGLENEVYEDLVKNIDSVIHAAALVKHYGNYESFYQSNVQTTINLLEFVKLTHGKDFHYISTNGIFLEGYIPNRSYYVFNEDDSPGILSNCNNFYLKTKYLGEVITRDYRQYGITSNIYRTGNLTANSITYHNQKNLGNNGFFHCLKTMLDLKLTAKELSIVEMTPVDHAALGIIKIFNQVNLANQVYHIFNPQLCDLNELFSYYDDLFVQHVDIGVFIDKIAEELSIYPYNTQLELFIVHQKWLQKLNYPNLTKIELLQDKTSAILTNLGFNWPKITPEMLSEIVKIHKTRNFMAKKLKVFEELEGTSAIIPYPLYWTDENVAIVGANSLLLQTLGCSLEAIVGKTPYEFYKAETADVIVKRFKEVMSTKKTSYRNLTDEMIENESSKNKFFMGTKTPIIDDNNNVVGVLGILIDAAEQKQADSLWLKDFRKTIIFQELKRVSEIIPSPLYWADANYAILGANEACLKAIGVNSESEVIGKTPYELYSKEAAEKILKNAQQVIKEKKIIRHDEVVEDISTGQNKYFMGIRGPILDENNEVIGVIGTTLDVTAEKENILLKVETEAQKTKIEEHEKFANIASQVSHDIRTPLASLLMIVKSCESELSETTRVALREAATSIGGIANNLLSKYTKPDAETNDTSEVRQPVLVSLSLLQILTDKKFQYKNLPIKFENNFEPKCDFVFINAEPIAFKRMVYNLINNAVDAFDGKTGEVILKLCSENKKIKIVIQDNGKGIPINVLDKIRSNIAITSDKQGGHGIGLIQVRETLERNNGKFEIFSKVGEGTQVILTFPIISSPAWIAEEIRIYPGEIIVILDDDLSIHNAWKMRFKKYADIVSLRHFTSGEEAIKFINSNDKNKIVLLADFELLKQELNGIHVIERTKTRDSILVTSHFNNQIVRNLVTKIGTKMLPKQLASEAPIKVIEKNANVGEASLKKADAIIIEDSKSLADGLAFLLGKRGKKADVYYSGKKFLKQFSQYSKDTKICIDYSLGSMTGVDIAKILHEAGFTKLYLFTGYDRNHFKKGEIPDYLTLIAKEDTDTLVNTLCVI